MRKWFEIHFANIKYPYLQNDMIICYETLVYNIKPCCVFPNAVLKVV
jgi:hypothetical protein